MVGETLSEACSIGRGVEQGCSLSPLLFIIYDEALLRKVCHECASRGKYSQYDKICR